MPAKLEYFVGIDGRQVSIGEETVCVPQDGNYNPGIPLTSILDKFHIYEIGGRVKITRNAAKSGDGRTEVILGDLDIGQSHSLEVLISAGLSPLIVNMTNVNGRLHS